MKLAPANQTFLPATSPGRQSFAVASPDDASAQLGRALRTAVSGAQLRSVTIVASRPDDHVVVVQAQYAVDSVASNSALPAVPKPTARSAALNRSTSYLSPIKQYARTQSGGDFKAAPLLDVRA